MAQLTPREVSALLSAGFVLVSTVWYIYLIVRKGFQPVLAAWIVTGCTMTLSFATYWTSPKHSIVSNACNAMSVLGAGSIMLIVVGQNIRQGVKNIRFNHFQKWCLRIAGLIMVFWIIVVWGFHGTGTVSNILTQILMIVGYSATAERVWHANKSTEPFFSWWTIAIASSIAVYTGYVSNDNLALIYGVRAAVTSWSLVYLLYRADRKGRLQVQTVVT